MPGTGGGEGAVREGKLTEVSYSGNQANALIHLYRAEVGKMTAYRQRLDMTTNWSVVTTAGLASFALGDVNNSHATFLFAMFMNYFFLRLEARRFRTFEIAHHRVRIMERFFYPAMLGDKVDAGWHQLLLAELAKPRSPMTRNDALGWRLNRNYLWIYAAVLLAWFAKLDLPAGISRRLRAGRHRQFSGVDGVSGGGRVLPLPHLAGAAGGADLSAGRGLTLGGDRRWAGQNPGRQKHAKMAGLP